MSTTINAGPETINRIADGAYPALAMLAGMQLDLFTPLADGPMTAEEIAHAIGAGSEKLKPLLYSLVAADLLTVGGDRFANTGSKDANVDLPQSSLNHHPAKNLLQVILLKKCMVRTKQDQSNLGNFDAFTVGLTSHIGTPTMTRSDPSFVYQFEHSALNGDQGYIEFLAQVTIRRQGISFPVSLFYDHIFDAFTDLIFQLARALM